MCKSNLPQLVKADITLMTDQETSSFGFRVCKSVIRLALLVVYTAWRQKGRCQEAQMPPTEVAIVSGGEFRRRRCYQVSSLPFFATQGWKTWTERMVKSPPHAFLHKDCKMILTHFNALSNPEADYDWLWLYISSESADKRWVGLDKRDKKTKKFSQQLRSDKRY